MTQPFHHSLLSKAATPAPGATMPTSNTPPVALTDMLTQVKDSIAQFGALWDQWQTGDGPATPDQTTIGDDPATDGEVVKARRRGIGVTDARWAAMLRRVSPGVASEIRSVVITKSLALATNAGIAPSEAVDIIKRIACDTQPRRSVQGQSLNAAAEAVARQWARQGR
ncbi:hypothetical protein [Nakamurella sp. PAMC28650]|uniref:hypothetical protein n=1 Tax=Nakamurella sp. PAMC28650 TaxID=2762325 RepID=UPI00164E201B|nr:hypothetical protein [Nakamurella sp. PAMC28650]QNK80417.1 hypothetical protein H7F38_19880 [Nakamurella sp. PAMC28650]